jgi:hypothetical protein
VRGGLACDPASHVPGHAARIGLVPLVPATGPAPPSPDAGSVPGRAVGDTEAEEPAGPARRRWLVGSLGRRP